MRALFRRKPRRIRPFPQSGGTECATAVATVAPVDPLHGALNAIDEGIVVLDNELCVAFVNRAFRRLSGVEARPSGEWPSFEELVHRLAGSRGGLPAQFERQVADCVAHARAGSRRPLEICLADGELVHQKSCPQPDGGRVVTFRTVTRLVRQQQEIVGLRAALSEVEHGIVLLDDKLRVRFINRAFRRMADLLDEFVDSRPSYVEILEHGRRTNAFDMKSAEIDRYIRDRLKMVREAHGTPIEIRWSRGRTVRARIAALPDGGRLLTYVDITDEVAAPELAPR
jgi:PAS domain-containing protein